MKDSYDIIIHVVVDRYGEQSLTMETVPSGIAAVKDVHDILNNLTNVTDHD